MTGTVGWWSWLLPFGKPHVAKAPACRGCGWRLHALRVGSLLVTVAVVLAVYFYAGPVLDGLGVPPGFRHWALLGLCLVALAPQFYWEALFPPPVSTTALRKTVVYSFRDREAAFEFRILNEGMRLAGLD